MSDPYRKHGIDPKNHPFDGPSSEAPLNENAPPVVPPKFATPEARQAEAERMASEQQQRTRNISQDQIPEFTPITGQGTLVYIKHNRPGATYISDRINGDIQIPGIGDYTGGEPPYLQMEAEQVSRVRNLQKLFSTPVRKGSSQMILEQVSEERYEREEAEWHEWAEEMNRKLDIAMAPAHTEESNDTDFRKRINWDAKTESRSPYRNTSI